MAPLYAGQGNFKRNMEELVHQPIQSKARAKGIRTLAKRKGISMKEARFQKALAISSHYARKKS